MKYPCGIIKDLLPLYIDDIANEESKIAIENHLAECKNCKKYYETMKSSDGFTEKNYNKLEDMEMADSLKKVKNRINKKIRNVIIVSVVAVLSLVFVFNLLFNMPIKNIDLNDISVTAASYPMGEVANMSDANYDSVKITLDETDNSEQYKLEIPAMPNADISVSEDAIEDKGFVSVITWNSPYNIKEIKYSDKTDDKTLYVEAFKTTLLCNKSKSGEQTTKNLEFIDIEKIVFIEDGQEKVLWSK